LPDETRRALWGVVDSRLWFLEMVAQNSEHQLEQAFEANLSA
jgi:hypothetical protein